MKPSLALIVLGSLIILATLGSAAVSRERDQQRVAEFYHKNTNSAVLPKALSPDPISLPEVIGFLTGGAMVGVGVVWSLADRRKQAPPL